MADIKDPENTLLMETTKGPVVIALRPDLAPEPRRAHQGAGPRGLLRRHRSSTASSTASWRRPADPQGTGTGGSGKKLKAEFSTETHVRGTRLDGARQRPEFRRQPVLHLLRRGAVPEQAIHGLGQGDEGMENIDKIKQAASRRDSPDKIVS